MVYSEHTNNKQNNTRKLSTRKPKRHIGLRRPNAGAHRKWLWHITLCSQITSSLTGANFVPAYDLHQHFSCFWEFNFFHNFALAFLPAGRYYRYMVNASLVCKGKMMIVEVVYENVAQTKTVIVNANLRDAIVMLTEKLPDGHRLAFYARK